MSFHQLQTLMRVTLLVLCIVQVNLGIQQPVLMARSEAKPNNPSGRPQRTATGGKRGSCPEVFPPLTALVPLAVATTASERPSFWFYSPYKGQALSATFNLQSDDNDVIQPITVTLPAKPSFVCIHLRSTDPPLKLNQSYHWFLKVFCSEPNQPKETVEGSIQRIASASPAGSPFDFKQEQTTVNESDDRLFDAIAALAALRLQKPQDPSLMEQWN